MKGKLFLRRFTDLAMTLILLLLMAYPVTGQVAHERLGIALLAFFLLHHLLNWNWFRALGKGRYRAPRLLQTALAFLLLLGVAAQIASGIAMSRMLPFLKFPVPVPAARLIHLSCGYWSLLLASLHLGLHWGSLCAAGQKLHGGRPFLGICWSILRVAAGGLAVYGAICFFRQGIAAYLFLRTEFAFFDYGKAPALVLGELLSIMVLWTLASSLLWQIAKK